MIFVTVGTHEQPFDRLVEYIDRLAEKNKLNEEIIIQTGYSTYVPGHCTWYKMLPYEDMLKYVSDARIVITHGGPSSFIMPLQIGKVPIVVPRQKDFNEHVNNHQLDFCLTVEKRMRNIIVVEDIQALEDTINNYDQLIDSLNKGLNGNNAAFCASFEQIAEGLFNKGSKK